MFTVYGRIIKYFYVATLMIIYYPLWWYSLYMRLGFVQLITAHANNFHMHKRRDKRREKMLRKGATIISYETIVT
jgi:hypothetical protein